MHGSSNSNSQRGNLPAHASANHRHPSCSYVCCQSKRHGAPPDIIRITPRPAKHTPECWNVAQDVARHDSSCSYDLPVADMLAQPAQLRAGNKLMTCSDGLQHARSEGWGTCIAAMLNCHKLGKPLQGCLLGFLFPGPTPRSLIKDIVQGHARGVQAALPDTRHV